MKEYTKRIQQLKHEIVDLESDLLNARSLNRKHLVRRLEMIINEKHQKIEKWSKL